MEQNKIFYKIMNDDLCHHEFQYKMGLNIDTVPFNPSGTCETGGLYFTDLENISLYLSFGTKLAFVTIPDDAKVYKEPTGNKYKADRIFINAVINLRDFEYWANEEFCLAAILKNYLSLKYVQNQTHELCLAAVKQNGWALKFIQKQTYKLCMNAVRQNGFALQYVQNKTPAICRAAVRQDERASRFITSKIGETDNSTGLGQFMIFNCDVASAEFEQIIKRIITSDNKSQPKNIDRRLSTHQLMKTATKGLKK